MSRIGERRKHAQAEPSAEIFLHGLVREPGQAQ